MAVVSEIPQSLVSIANRGRKELLRMPMEEHEIGKDRILKRATYACSKSAACSVSDDVYRTIQPRKTDAYDATNVDAVRFMRMAGSGH
jgi:hypothetical protein